MTANDDYQSLAVFYGHKNNDVNIYYHALKFNVF